MVDAIACGHELSQESMISLAVQVELAIVEPALCQVTQQLGVANILNQKGQSQPRGMLLKVAVQVSDKLGSFNSKFSCEFNGGINFSQKLTLLA